MGRRQFGFVSKNYEKFLKNNYNTRKLPKRIYLSYKKLLMPDSKVKTIAFLGTRPEYIKTIKVIEKLKKK